MDDVLLEAENRGKLRDPGFSLKRGEIRPGDTAAVLARSRNAPQAIAFPMQWGFHTEHGLVFNARMETVQSKPLFSESFLYRRCLIPMSAYFEWDHRQKPMLKYRFEPTDVSYACFAGLYRYENQNPVFTILTRNAAQSIACFHDRMPVILNPQVKECYLLGSPDEALHLIHESMEQLAYGAVW